MHIFTHSSFRRSASPSSRLTSKKGAQSTHWMSDRVGGPGAGLGWCGEVRNLLPHFYIILLVAQSLQRLSYLGTFIFRYGKKDLR
jgi:hypothetical protein